MLRYSVYLLDWWESWWRRLGTGNRGGYQDIDRRVLPIREAEEVGGLGLITCVWDGTILALRGETGLQEIGSLVGVFGAESAIRPDSLQRAGALGLLHRRPAMDVVDAEGLDDGAEGEDKTQGNGRYGTFNKDTTGWNDYDTLWMTRNSFYL